MLFLERRKNEMIDIRVNDIKILIKYMGVSPKGSAILGFEAPAEVNILRTEVKYRPRRGVVNVECK